MGFQDYLASLGDNPYFGAGAGLFGVGVLTQAARKGSVILTTILRRKYVLTMEVPRWVGKLLSVSLRLQASNIEIVQISAIILDLNF